MSETEKTQENKARFFALYLGSMAFMMPDWLDFNDDRPMAVDAVYLQTGSRHLNSGFLSLRSISSLTDEEIKELAKIRYPTLPEHDPRLLEWGKLIHYAVIDDISHLEEMSFAKILAISDYLRSIGILIPWIDLSVEDIVSYGWAVINKGENI